MWDAAYVQPGEPSDLQVAIREAVAASEKTRDALDSELRAALGTKGKPLWDIDRGKSKRPEPRTLRAIEQVLDLEPDSLVDLVHIRQQLRSSASHTNTSPEQPKPRTADAGETAPVLRLDLSYSMGPGTNLDDSYIEGEEFQFDVGFLRGLTITPPDRLRIVDGVGTSMEPTFHDRDLLIVDINQRDLNAQDRVWACWIFGLGAVKRLRAVGKDRVLVISDNPGVDNQEVGLEDILIHGRVVGSIKRH